MYRDSDTPGPLLIIGFGEHVVAVHRRTGVVAWQHQEDGYSPRLHVHGGFVILGYPRHFACLDYTTGKLKWKTLAPEGVGTDTVLVDGDEIFFGDRGCTGCIDVKSGALLWHHPFKGMGAGDVALGVPGNATQRDRF